MSIALRTKILLGTAASIATYVFMGPGDVQTSRLRRHHKTANHSRRAGRQHTSSKSRSNVVLVGTSRYPMTVQRSLIRFALLVHATPAGAATFHRHRK